MSLSCVGDYVSGTTKFGVGIRPRDNVLSFGSDVVAEKNTGCGSSCGGVTSLVDIGIYDEVKGKGCL